MTNGRLKVAEGDWFAVPLRNGGFCLGVAARVDPRGIIVGYFFPEYHAQVPELENARHMDPRSAVVMRCGDLGFREGAWPILGSDESWQRSSWPLPLFTRTEPLTERCLLVEYGDDDLAAPVRESPASAPECRGLPDDILNGAGAVELILTAATSEAQQS